ncbi:hypothetical protein H6G26_10040 [Nostoc sp. FACHB-888]|nr:hypothetical protein [Nostoc sp. FACHB-888]
MTATLPVNVESEIFYPSADGQPVGEIYEPIQDGRSEPLQLRLVVEGRLIGFYRENTGEKLLIPNEQAEALRQEVLARQQAEELAEQERQRAEQERQRAEQAELQIEQLKARLRSPLALAQPSLNVDPDTIQ